MTIEIRRKIAASDFQPKRLLARPDSERQLLLGIVGGVADGIHRLTDPRTEEVHEGLKGSFRAEIVGLESPVTIGAGVLWFPAGLGDSIMHVLAQDPKATVEFVFELYAIRASNANGYSWAAKPVVSNIVEDRDPVAQLFAKYKSASAPALAAPTETPAAAPEKAATKK